MNKFSLKMVALMAAMTMTMMSFVETQDFGGRVIDEKGEPMPYVNVVLLSLPDSAFVQGAMTDDMGVFKIVTDISDGLFKVTSVGYQTLYIKAANNITIQMKEDTQLLKEVVVKGQLPKTHVKADASGRSVAVEYMDNRMVVTESPFVTNHYLCEEKFLVGLHEGDHRHEKLMEQYEKAGGVMNEKELTDAIVSVTQLPEKKRQKDY